MELLLIKLVALLRPLASVEVGRVLFEVAGVGLFAILAGGLLVRMSVTNSLRISSTDALIVAFVVWCTVGMLIYFDASLIEDWAKLLIPLISYSLVKNIVQDRRQYVSVVSWMIAGFAGPILVSAALIMIGNQIAIDMVNYWTGVVRWDGVFGHAHTLGHSMTLFLMTAAVWYTLRAGEGRGRSSMLLNGAVGLLVAVALYCLYMSQVRSALLGLLVFAVVYLFYFNRKLLLFGSIGTAVVAGLTISYWLPALLPEVIVETKGPGITLMDIGSGRPRLWLNDLQAFLQAPIDQKLAGIDLSGGEVILLGHNDWISLLTRTGLIGIALYAGLQIAIFRKMMSMPLEQRYLYLALFLAVNVMMLVSNSYAWRIQVSQLYYMLLAFVEVPHQRSSAAVPALRRLHV